jgi:excisionase family DNA binding protein
MTLPAAPRHEAKEPTTGPTPAIELLTVDEVAALLKVSRSWVYEHTRRRGRKDDQLPHLKLGKFVRFDPRLVREFLARRSRTQ